MSTAQSLGELDYNALLVKGVKRFSNGFSALVSYTFGKAIDLVSNNDGPIFTNIFDPYYDRGRGRLRRDPHPGRELRLRAALRPEPLCWADGR